MWLLIFYLGYFVCHLGLLCSFSDNFVVSRYLIKDILLLLSSISSSHHIIALPAICGSASSYSTTCICNSASHYLFHYMPFVVVVTTYSGFVTAHSGLAHLA
jgi:hypothetical protein